jgi:hypothetical protein
LAPPSQPAFLTDARILPTIIYWIERGVHTVAAARKAGVKESEIEGWLDKGRAGKEPFVAFTEEVDAALNEYELKLSGVVHEAATRIDRPDVSAAKWALERRFPKRWRAKDDVVPVIPQRPDGKAYSSEELRAAAEIQDAAAARAKARLEAERKSAS